MKSFLVLTRQHLKNVQSARADESIRINKIKAAVEEEESGRMLPLLEEQEPSAH